MNPEMESNQQKWGKVLTVVVCVLLAAVIAVGILFGDNRFSLVLTPAGEQVIIMEYGGLYQEQGANLLFSGSRFWQAGFVPEVEVHMSGTVDTGKTGIYTVTYSAEYLLWKAETERTVEVVDRKAPEIRLNGQEEIYVLPGSTYTDEGCTAVDEYDGDLTSQIQSATVNNVTTYWVCDAAGNRAEVSRTVHYEDIVPPEINLTDGETIQIFGGSTYVEPGFAAFDNCDGDLTQSVECFGEVNSFFCGTYELTYRVTDSFGNTTEVIRSVEVIPCPRPEEVIPEGKIIYLTFDDGPGPYTRELLEILDKYDVKATFFVVCNKYSDVIGEMAEAGHTVAIHTACHDYKTIYASEEAYFADLLQVRDLIYAETGIEANLLRFPGGSSNKVSRFNKGIMTRLTEMVQDVGFQYFDWNVDSRDAGGAKTASEVYENVIDGVSGRKVSVVLQHDIKPYSVDAVERIIKWGLRNGYVFLPLETTSPCFHHRLNN